ncbi:putative ATP-dependent RNA helicase spindle-E, partial [Stegodyphus mimosarum]
MTTSNEITLDHIKSFFSLDDKLEELYVAPTATGGVGIDNIDKFPPPFPLSKCYRKKGTDYVKKYLEKEENENRRQAVEFPGSALSINTLDDVEESSTVGVDALNVNDLNDATKELYSTYYQVPNRSYDPDLLITSYREQILRQLHINPVIIIQGPTGCGKTTQVPQYILDYHISRGLYCNIIVTQPRKIAAISIARRVCKERNWQLKSIVGYQVTAVRMNSSFLTSPPQ